MPLSRARVLEPLEPRRLLAIDLAVAGVSVDSDDNKLLQSLAADSIRAGTNAGQTLIAYSDLDDNTGKGQDIYLRKFNAAGAPIGSESLVNTTFAGAQMNPDIAVNDSGAYAVVWQSEAQDGGGWGIYMRYVNPGASVSTGEILVNTNTTGDQITPKVAIDASGNVVVTWLDNGSNLGDVYARRYSAAGTAVGAPFVVSGNTALAYAAPVVAAQGNGAFALAWEGRDPNGANTADVQFRAYDANGSAVGSTSTVNTTVADDQAEPAIAAVGSGYLVAYSDNRTDGSSSVYRRLYNAGGTATTTALLSNQDADGTRSRPAVVGDSSGNFVIGWTLQPPSATYSYAVMRSYDKNNAATSNELQEGDGSSAQTLFDIAMTGTGRFRDISTLGEDVGDGVGMTAGYANVIDVVGTSAADSITVSEINSGATVRVKNGANSSQSDYVRSAFAYLTADLGDGTDLFNAATFNGTGGLTTLPVSVNGGNGNDTIYGGAAGDSIFGDAGTDQLHGGASKDYITGGDDNDVMYGDDGNDNLVSGAGKNTIFGGNGDDRITGSGGHDHFYGEDGADRLYGGAGNDTLDGGGGTDRIYGGAGNDSIVGGSSNDRLYGEDDNDTIAGNAGKDYLFGGDGNDTRASAEANDILDSIEVNG